MSKLGQDSNGNVVQAIRQGTVQAVAYTATHAESAAFGAATTIIYICATTACYVLVSTAGTAATSSNGTLLPALVPMMFIVNPGQKISAVRSTADGTLSVTEGA